MNKEEEIFTLCKEWIDMQMVLYLDNPNMDYVKYADNRREVIHRELWDLIGRAYPRDFIYIAEDRVRGGDWQDRVYNGEERRAVLWDYADRLTKQLLQMGGST